MNDEHTQQMAMHYCRGLRDWHYKFQYAFALQQQRDFIHGMIRYLGVHSPMINGTSLDGLSEDDTLLAEMADGDAGMGDYLSTVQRDIESFSREYLLMLGCHLTDNEWAESNYGINYEFVKSLCEKHEVRHEVILRKLGEDEDYMPLELVWLEAVEICANYHLQSWDGNCCSRYIGWKQDQDFCNYQGQRKPMFYPWLFTGERYTDDFGNVIHGASCRIEFGEGILSWFKDDKLMEKDWRGKMHAIRSKSLVVKFNVGRNSDLLL